MDYITILSGMVLVASFIGNIYQYKRLKNEEIYISLRVKGWSDDAQVITNVISTIEIDINNNPEMLAKYLISGLKCIGQSANSIHINMKRELKRLDRIKDIPNNNYENQHGVG